jgi:hypothetical protein
MSGRLASRETLGDDKVSGRAIYAVIINAAELFRGDHSQTPLYKDIFGELPPALGSE